MKPVAELDLPPEKQADLARARKLEIGTLLYLLSSTALLALTMGTSQAMRTSFFEEVFSGVPALAFLVCSRIARRRPNADFPYGYHGAVSIGYLTASLALAGMGVFLLVGAFKALVTVERTTIGGMTLGGNTVWAGWPMLIAIAYASIPSIFLGRAKMKLAPRLHDKILYADATMMKADWMAETATAIGVIGVGLGVWWLDPVAAALVSLDIFKDGVVNTHVAVRDLMEHRPMKTDRSGTEPLPEQLRACMEALDWVAHAEVRLREVGHVFFGEVFLTPSRTPHDLPACIAAAAAKARALNWRLHDVTVMVVEP